MDDPQDHRQRADADDGGALKGGEEANGHRHEEGRDEQVLTLVHQAACQGEHQCDGPLAGLPRRRR